MYLASGGFASRLWGLLGADAMQLTPKEMVCGRLSATGPAFGTTGAAAGAGAATLVVVVVTTWQREVERAGKG